jgi:hypothetical protein
MLVLLIEAVPLTDPYNDALGVAMYSWLALSRAILASNRIASVGLGNGSAPSFIVIIM